MDKKLYRSRKEKMIAGVCGGLAEYFNIDVTLVRIVVAILAVASFGTFLLAYLLCVIIIPERTGEYVDPATGQPVDYEKKTNVSPEESADRDRKVRQFIGLGLIALGVMFFMRRFFYWFDGDFIWSLLIIGVGVVLVVFGSNRNNQ